MDTLQTRKSFCYSFKISSQDTVWIHPRRGGHSITLSDFSNQIQTRYAPDTEVILFLIQIQLSISSTDTLQTRKSFCHLFRSRLQFRYTPDTEVILLLTQISASDTVQICSRHGFHSVPHSELIPNTQLLHTQMLLCYPFTIQIHSRHDSHSDIHSKIKYSYSSDMFQFNKQS